MLERQAGTDPQGFSGLQDQVDDHWGELFKAALLSTLLSVGSEAGTSGQENSLVQAIHSGADNSISQTGSEVVERQLNIQPTLTIRPGFPVRVFVNHDMVLAPQYGGMIIYPRRWARSYVVQISEFILAEAYIIACTRTAGGKRKGRLSGHHPAILAGMMLDEVARRAAVDPSSIDDVILGCVSQIGEQSSNIGRNAILSSKTIPESVPGMTVERQCGSSQQAFHFAAQAVMSGAMDIVIAGGVESMTRVPMGSTTALAVQAGMATSTNAQRAARYPGVEFSQFAGAEVIADKYGLTKRDLDLFALHSHRKAAAATEAGAFRHEIFPVLVATPEGQEVVHESDEGIRFGATEEGIAGVKLISETGRLTAATASQICDGASGMILVNEIGLKRLNATPLARVHQMTVVGGDPVVMLESPIAGTQRALERAGLTIDDIDLFEVNEAFASIPLAWLQATGAAPDRLNVFGGAIALGHPLGASGTRLMTTLVHALHARNGRYGLQAMCEGGGMANVTIVEKL